MAENEAGGGGECSWGREVNRYLNVLGMAWEELAGMEAGVIKERVNQWETGRWRSEVESKSTLVWYRERQGIGGEAGYENSWGSVLLFRVRSNSLRLGWREKFWGGDVRCPLCRG